MIRSFNPRRGAVAALVLAGALALLPAAASRANDTSVVLGAGGLVPTKSDAVAMEDEDLYIGAREIRVRYRFRNTGPRDVTTTVAFPLPPVPLDRMYSSPVEWPAEKAPNFLNFSVTVDGRAVPFETEVRAVQGERDITSDLRRLKVPVVATDGLIYEALGRLPAATRRALIDGGMAEAIDETEMMPHWTVQTSFYWTQVFPAGRPVQIEHRYQPVVGSTWVTFGGPERAGKLTAYAPRRVLGPDDSEGRAEEGRDVYCIDPGTEKAIVRLATKNKPPARDAAVAVYAQVIEYILTSAATWHGPIGHFRLTLDKGDPKNVLSVCLNGLRRSGDTTFVFEADAFTPKRELTVLIVQPDDGQ